jgi:hypothetical protein
LYDWIKHFRRQEENQHSAPTMLNLRLSLLFSVPFAVQADTRVSVIELGKGGSVQRTNSRDSLTTVKGVASFWSALHSPRSVLQHAGMTVVPDLFTKASNGIVIGLKGSGVDAMPFVSKLLEEEGSNGVVGVLEVQGEAADGLFNKVDTVDTVEASSFASFCKKHSRSEGLTGVVTTVDDADSAAFDSMLREIVASLDADATAAGKTIVLHLVVEDDAVSPRSNRLSRRLEGDEDEAEGDANADANNQGQQKNGYYGYGYYNSYGEWVSVPLKLHAPFA